MFLIGELAYKLKKPVRTAFLDFSTRQRRLDACLREVELNRRLATLLATGAPLADQVRQLAGMLSAFHAGARRDPEITAEGGRDALRARWADNFEELRGFRATVLDGGLVAEWAAEPMRPVPCQRSRPL